MQRIENKESSITSYASRFTSYASRFTPHILWAIVSLYVVLGVIYSLATPIMEASDEFKHYPYVRYVQVHHDLPVLYPEICLENPPVCPWLQDGGQPPIYYALLAAATSWIDTSDLTELRRVNWHAFIGDPGQVCNKNLIIHQPEREQFPWQGAVLAIHICRLITVGIGAGSVLLSYLSAREVFPDRPALALGATALTAFNPMFIFVNASVNNDAMTTFVGCLNLLVFLRLVRDSVEGRLPIWRYGLVGLTMGLFLLTKLSALTALVLLPVLLAWISYRRRSREPGAGFWQWDWRPLLVGLPIILGISALLSGWWFARNWRLYGDLTGLNAFIAIQGRRGGFPSLRDWVEEFVTFRWTYWGLFGAVDVPAPLWAYRFFDALSLVALIGFGAWMVRRWRQKDTRFEPESLADFLEGLWWIPAGWACILFVSVLRWTWIFYSFQGRFLFPNIGGISTLLMLGLHQWVPRRYRPALSAGVGVILLVIAAMIPFTSILPAYAHPEPLTLEDVPAEARVDPVEIGDVARIVGWDVQGPEPQVVKPNDPAAAVDVVVYWEAVAPDGKDYISFARLLGREHELAGAINRRPACGMVPTDLWEPDQVWRDPYHIPLAKDARAPSRLRIEVGLYDPAEDETLGVARVGEAKLAPPERIPADVWSAKAAHSLEVKLADGVSLTGYALSAPTVSPGEPLTLTLRWEAREAPSTDYQVFVHLLGEQADPVAQADGPPLMGDYPTSMWSAGEVIVDPHVMALPDDLAAGEAAYRLMVGMYNLETMERLPRLDGQGASIEIPVRMANDE